tara:strand:+ start:109 stop:1203 length:1095 start_codon:yes stop_codon:yes gene_type:complete
MSIYDQIVGGLLGTARDAGRYYRETNPADRGVLDFIEKKHSGALSRPGDPVNIPLSKFRPLNDGNLIRGNPMMPDNGQIDPQVVDDGSVIESYQLNNNLAMKTQPILENQSQPAPSQGVLSNPRPSNRRDQTPMSFKPQVIDDNEMLIRMGLAGLGANREGATASLGAMGDMYGAIQDANRSGLNSYNLAMQEAQAKAADAKAKTLQENQAKAGQLDQTIFDMDQALANLEGGMELTGWLDSTIGAAWDSMKGNPEAAARLLLKKLKVDDALLRVAQTKGAISNNEMKLFLSPAPADTEDEKVWIDWIKKRRDAAVAIRHRLLTGERVNPNEQATTDQVNQYGSGQSASPTYSAEDQALIDKYQ